MIFIDDNNRRKPYMANFKMYHDKDIIDRIRKIYDVDKEIRECSIPVVDKDDNIIYFASWVSNNDNPPDDLKGIVYIPEFWNYSLEESILDTKILEEYDTFEFEKADEYSIFVTKVINKLFKDKKVVFHDVNARYFFDVKDYSNIKIVSDSLVFNKHNNNTLYLSTTDKLFENVIKSDEINLNKFTTLNAIAGLLWQNDRVSYGGKNPDKTFYLIKSKLGFLGMADLIRFCLYRAEMARSHGLIPIIDMSIPGDDNQFNYGDGTNAWTMYFKQINDYPLSEIYQSKNVIIGKEQLFYVNPYLAKIRFSKDLPLLINENLIFSKVMQENAEKLLTENVKTDLNKILAVVARGTDYNNPAVLSLGLLKKPIETSELISEVKKVLKEKGLTHIFLATEDQDIFNEFMNSDLKDCIYSVNQKRYTLSEIKNGYLNNQYHEDKTDTYSLNKTYLGIIYILSKCAGIMSSTVCGAYDIAIGLNGNKYIYNEVLNKTSK